MRRTYRTTEQIRALTSVARGDSPPDLLVSGGSVLNVYSGELLPAEVAVVSGRVAYVGARRLAAGPETVVLDARGRVVAPGYVDPHGHPQALITPSELARAVLPLGTTAIVADTLIQLRLMRPDRTREAMETLADLPLRFFWFLRVHGQAHSPIDATIMGMERLEGLLGLEDVRAVGEITRWPEAYAGEAGLQEKLSAALGAGRRVEGHAPGVSADRLQVLAGAGFSSDHEAIDAEQALARLRAGLFVILRHGSLRPDLPALARMAGGDRAFSGRIMLSPDGPNPLFVHTMGYMDHALKTALEAGIDPLAAYQMATLNPASYFGLDEELGGLAPGRRADILVLPDLGNPRPEAVVAGGRIAAEDGRLLAEFPVLPWERWLLPLAPGAWRPTASVFSLEGLPPTVPAMHLENTEISIRREVSIEDPPGRGGSDGYRLPEGVLGLFFLDPGGGWRCRTLLSGFAKRLGGMASTYSSGGGIYVMGRSPSDMAAAATRALDLGGGIVVFEKGTLLFELPLPLGGLMSTRTVAEAAGAVSELTALLRERGYDHHDITYSLLFLGFDSLPYVRLTYRGLWDVMRGETLIPREEMG